MKIYKVYILFYAVLFLLSYNNTAQACSMYKITAGGKTMVGCNEDAWRTTARIWFVNAGNTKRYGAGFTGSRYVSAHRIAPQSGMNEAGLVFSRLSAYYPLQNNPFINRIKITNEADYLSGILHSCGTIEEVKNYIEQYDHSVFINDVFIYIDSTGKYLVVEPYNIIVGDDAYYVLSNFCPSITDNEKARKLERYRKGEDFLKAHTINSSLSFCSALSNEMHVCRNRNGDGTLLTSIWDTKDKLVNLYFYHSYDSTVQFSLSEELAKGDTIINIPALFAGNAEFERLTDYITPFNTPVLRISLVVTGGILTFFILLYGIYLVRNKKTVISYKTLVLVSAMNLLLTAYLFILATNINIYYFDAPYIHYNSNIISASSYIPFLLLFTIVPFSVFTVNRVNSDKTKWWIKSIIVFNNLVYLLLVAAFAYWGLYSVWS